MSAIVVPCPHCSKHARLDASKLPDHPVFFPCPHCKERVVVDKRQLVNPQQGVAAAAPPPPASENSAAGDSAEITLPSVEPMMADSRFGKVPVDATCPSGMIVGEDEAAVEEIRQTLTALGSEVEHVRSADEARQTIITEQLDLCIFVAGEVEAAPHAPMRPLCGLQPSLRRRLYLMLVADNLKTFDGNAAFMHEVDMVLARQDLARLGAALWGGLEHHRRLYKTYFAACDKNGTL